MKKPKKKPAKAKAKAKAPAKKTVKISGNAGSRITPFLMFNGDPSQAAKFYVSVFKNSKIVSANPMQATFILDGQKFLSFNGGPHFSFNEGISLFVSVETQQEIDFYWNKLTADGGSESMCGWLKDKYGISWQIIPAILMELLGHKDRAKADRAMQAMLKMRKIDIAALKKAAG